VEWCSYTGTDDRKIASYVRRLVKQCDQVLAIQVATLAQHYTVLRSSQTADTTRQKVSAMWRRLEDELSSEAIAAAAVAEAGTVTPGTIAPLGPAEASLLRIQAASEGNEFESGNAICLGFDDGGHLRQNQSLPCGGKLHESP
jgi:hypothetical protein